VVRVVGFAGRIKVVRAKGYEYVRIYVDEAETDLAQYRDARVRGIVILDALPRSPHPGDPRH
jgi:hypothetical protein